MKKKRSDLIQRISRRSNHQQYREDALGLQRVIAFLQASDWINAIEAARDMDTNVREEIPQWGWDMMRNAVVALEYLKQLG